MLSNPLLEFIAELKRSNKIPEIIPDALAQAIASSGNLDFIHYEEPRATALGYAAAGGDVALVKALIDLGASPQKLNGAYQTLLHIAALQGNLGLVVFALNNMTPEMLTLTNYDGRNVFHFACENGNPEVIDYLMKDSRVNALVQKKNLFGLTPLDVAISKGNDKAIQLLDPGVDIATLAEYSKKPVNLSQDHLEAQLTQYLNLRGATENSENVIFKFGMCQGWSWLRQIYLTQGKEEEYLALITLIATWDGTEQSLLNQELPDALKDKYQKIFRDGRKEPGDVAFVFENFISGLNVAFAKTAVFNEFNLGVFQDDRIKQFELLRSPTDNRIIKNSFNIPYNNYNKEQLIEVLELLAKWPGMNIDIMRRGHAVTLNVTPAGLFDYYDSGLEKSIDHFMSPAELAEHFIKTDLSIDVEFRAFKFYQSDELIPEVELPTNGTALLAASPNGYSPLHLAVLENNPQKLRDLLKTGAYDIKTPDAHGFTPLKLALRANHPECALCLFAHNQPNPITHSSEIDFEKIGAEPYGFDMNTYENYADAKVLTFDECLVLKKLMAQGELPIDFKDKNGVTLAKSDFWSKNEHYKSDPRFVELKQFIDAPQVITAPIVQQQPIEKLPPIRHFDALKNAIADLDVTHIQDELSHMTANEMAFINNWHQHVNIMMREGFSIIPPYDLVINCTMKCFLETGDVSLVKQCVDILNLLKAKGWDGIVYNGIIEKVFNFEVFYEAPFERFNVRDYPHFDESQYDEFATILTKRLREDFATWEETSFGEYIASLEKQIQAQQTSSYPATEQLEKQLQHVKAIAALRAQSKYLPDAPHGTVTKIAEVPSTVLPEDPLEPFLTESGAIDLSKLTQLPVGSTHFIYKIPGNDDVLLKVVIESLYEDANTQQRKLGELAQSYATLYESFGEERCLVESRFIQKIKDPNNPVSQQAICSFVKFDKCFQSENRFGFNTEAVECNEMKLKEHAAQYHDMNMSLLGNDRSLAFNEEDFLTFHTSFRPVFAKLDAEPGLREAMREFLGKFKEYYHKTGNLVDLIGFDNVLFYQDKEGAWQYKVGAILKGLTREKTAQIIHEIDSNPAVVQSSFENWVPIFYMPSCLRILNATAEKVGIGRIVDDIALTRQDSENLSNMYEMLSLQERVFYCADGDDLSFEDAIYNLAQFILDNRSQKFFSDNLNDTQIMFGQVLEGLVNKHAATLTDKSHKMISVINELIRDDTQLERAKKLSSLYELGLDVRKSFSLPEGGRFVYQPDVSTQTSQTDQQRRKHYLVSKKSHEQSSSNQPTSTSKTDETISVEQRVTPKKKK